MTQSQKLLNLKDFKVNVELYQQLDPRPMFVFHCFLFGSLRLSFNDCKNKVKTTCEIVNEHNSIVHVFENQALRSRDKLSDKKKIDINPNPNFFTKEERWKKRKT